MFRPSPKKNQTRRKKRFPSMSTFRIYLILVIAGFLGQLLIGNTIMVTGITFILGLVMFNRQRKTPPTNLPITKTTVFSDKNSYPSNQIAWAFYKINNLYRTGILDETQYKKLGNEIQILDNMGNYWSYGVETGSWYQYHEGNWIKKQPNEKLTIINI